MITSISLQNYKSFGAQQTVPLEPITVVVGPNNAGKSSFLGVGRFVQMALQGAESVTVRQGGVDFQSTEAIEREGGTRFVFYRPPVDGGDLRLGWEAAGVGGYAVCLRQTPRHVEMIDEKLWAEGIGHFVSNLQLLQQVRAPHSRSSTPFLGLRIATTPGQISDSDASALRPIYEPLLHSRMVKLSLEALRQDAEVVPDPQLGSDGAGLAAVLGLWRGSEPERSEALDAFLRSTLPEIKRALVRPGPTKASQRLWIEQVDGEQFDAPHLSDGILFFTGLAMHALSVPEGAILFIEEPELCVHPRRLSSLVDLFRRLAAERKCQFVITTHSPVLLNQFRDEPASIVLFQRGQRGTQVRRLTDLPDLVDVLYKTEPGDMLANGFFNEPF